MTMKQHTGARLGGHGRRQAQDYDRGRVLAIEAGQYLKLKNPNVDVTVRDLEGVEDAIVVQWQQPRGIK